MPKPTTITAAEKKILLTTLEARFENNKQRHTNLQWKDVLQKIETNSNALQTLHQMEITGGEPDVVSYDKKSNTYTFYDCSEESPKLRRSFCYDAAALISRKENKPKDSAEASAVGMGITMLDEEEYRFLQTLGHFDNKTSSWLLTPPQVRKLGGALFGDYRFGSVFIYHNGAESYYAARGFRGKLVV